jgi:hypothetical protein
MSPANTHGTRWRDGDWDVDRRDYMMAEPLVVDAAGYVNLSDAPGMGYAPNEPLLAKTLNSN